MVRVQFVEPPKDYWFVMGEYLPPPYGILQLAAYIAEKMEDVDIEVLDCQAMSLDWSGLEKHMKTFDPDIVAASGLATCNVYITARTLELAKKLKPNIVTVTGGQHFTALAQESLEAYPEIDVIIRGEGEETFLELVKAVKEKSNYSAIKGLSYRHGKQIFHNRPRPLIENLDQLPFPGYRFVKGFADRYHFTMMAGSKAKYGIVEASRGCPNHCSFCSQWKHWQGTLRHKSVKRVADEMEYLYNNYGSKFQWLTDDNFGLNKRTEDLCDELIKREFSKDITCFMQVRCDDAAKNPRIVEKLSKAGFTWFLLGVESQSKTTLDSFHKGTKPEDASTAVKLLKQNGIFSQATCIVGNRHDTAESIKELRFFIHDIDPDIAIFMVLTPFPGTDLYEEAKSNGWIEDFNWANYDMVHATMPTNTLTRERVQRELTDCYRSFYGSGSRLLKGVFAKNKVKRRVYRYMARQGVIRQLESIV